MLLIRTGDDDDVWNDVLWRMGELPGMRVAGDGSQVGPAGAADAGAASSIPRRLVVADDPAWRGATAEEVAEALEEPGIWVPDLVVLTDDRTARNAEARTLLAFGSDDGDISGFWITPRQAAMTYLVLNRPLISFVFEDFAERAPTEPEWEVEDDEELGEDHLYEPVGVTMEALSNPPRYTRPDHELPVLDHDIDLLVRTDFTDDAAWASLVDQVAHPADDLYDDDLSDHVRLVDDPAFAGATPEQVLAHIRPSDDEEGMFAEVVLIADATTLHRAGQRVLVVPMSDDVGLTFRVDADQVRSMLINLALSNQDIDDWRGEEKEEAEDA
ncbi:DUF6924 domain-containing protein [Streptomyces tsukubensis]|nr:hypothetical protein [Streptomyces tsukubensis]